MAQDPSKMLRFLMLEEEEGVFKGEADENAEEERVTLENTSLLNIQAKDVREQGNVKQSRNILDPAHQGSRTALWRRRQRRLRRR